MYNAMHTDKNVKLLALITKRVHIEVVLSELTFVPVHRHGMQVNTILSIGNCQLYCFQSNGHLINLIARATIFQHMA